MRPEEIVSCAIVKVDALMLLYRDEGKVRQWELPGGRVRWEEPNEQAAVRKVREQLGVSAVVGTCLGDWDFEQRNDRFHSTVFSAKIGNDPLPRVLQPVHTGYEYFSLSDLHAAEQYLSPNVQTLLGRFLEGKVRLAIK